MVTAPGQIDLTTLPDPSPAPGEVVVEVSSVGLCGTDLHIVDGHHGRLPIVPGHEFAGTVVGLGADVTRLRLGDRVAVDPNLPCGACRSCHAERSNLCPDLGALGVTTAGAAAELVRAPAAACVRLAPELELVSAALVEPLSCAVHAFDVLRARPGTSLLVYGAGTMGLMLLELAKRAGALSVDLVDVDPARLERARRFGCSGAATSASELDRPQGWDVVVDASGNADAIRDGLGRVADGGTFLQFGVTAPDVRVSFSPYDVYRREITITGSMAVLHSFARAADLLASGLLDPASFITRRVPLAEYEPALRAFRRGEGLKTLVLP
jgi:2-desacetyl-2-hydroxyethyl bacteriochlorophyllide A dehydrogenase